MGSFYQSYAFSPDVTKDQLPSKWNALVQQALHEDGHGGYSGTFAEKHGFRIQEQDVFASEALADAFLEEASQKYDPAIIVRIRRRDYNERKLGEDPRIKELRENFHSLEKTLSDERKLILSAVFPDPLPVKFFRTCTSCKSRIALVLEDKAYGELLKRDRLDCPVCGTRYSLLKPGELRKVNKCEAASLKERVRTQKHIEKIRDAIIAKQPIIEYFYVGGLCVS